MSVQGARIAPHFRRPPLGATERPQPAASPLRGLQPAVAARSLPGFKRRTPAPSPVSQFLYRRYEPILPTSLTYIILSLEATNRTDLMRIEYVQAR